MQSMTTTSASYHTTSCTSSTFATVNFFIYAKTFTFPSSSKHLMHSTSALTPPLPQSNTSAMPAPTFVPSTPALFPLRHPPPFPHFPRSFPHPLIPRATSRPVRPLPPLPTPSQLPQLRLSQAPRSPAQRLRRISLAIPLMYLPATALLLTRTAASHLLHAPPLSLPNRLLCISLLIISPEFMSSAYANLHACALVAARRVRSATHTPRLARPVRIHAVLTSLTAAGTLSGLVCALFRPTSGAHIALLFQLVFYLARRLRFEQRARVYRCDSRQYRDIVYACVVASLCVLAVQMAFLPRVMAAFALFLACAFWILKWLFVPTSARIF